MDETHLSVQDVERILTGVRYSDWTFVTGHMGDGSFLQCAFHNGQQHGRKWYVSTYATRSEVVQTAFKAVLTALEHEAREEFTYRGEAIFGPHFNVDALHDLAVSRAPEVRRPYPVVSGA